jgi:protein-tyrosine phosphatase
LQQVLDQEGIPLKLVVGADNHITPSFVAELRSGHLLSLADTRYVLVEPPHHVAPPRLEDLFFSLLVAGFVPILTHPERLTWIESHYQTIQRLGQAGVWMQLTAGSLSGAFGRTARYWGERMLDEGLAHLLATDAHDVKRRPPNLGQGREFAAKRVGDAEAEPLVVTRPRGVLMNEHPSNLPGPKSAISAAEIVYDDVQEGADGRARKEGTHTDRAFAGAGRLRTALGLGDTRDTAGGGSEGRTSVSQVVPEGDYNDALALVLMIVGAFCSASEAVAQGFNPYSGDDQPASKQPKERDGFSPMQQSGAGRAAPATGALARTAYRIGPLDVLEISVFGVPELSGTVEVSDGGNIQLAVLGETPRLKNGGGGRRRDLIETA